MMAAYDLQQAGDAGMSFFKKAFRASAEVEHLLTNLRMNIKVGEADIEAVRRQAAHRHGEFGSSLSYTQVR